MCYTVSAENVLTWALLKNMDGVSISFVRRLSEVAQRKVDDCAFDVSASSLYAVVEDSDMFEWVENLIVFSNRNNVNLSRIQSSLEYRLPEEINRALATCNL